MRKESDIQKAICKYLKMRQHRFHRMNNVGVYDAKRKGYRKTHYGLRGVPDIYVFDRDHGTNKGRIVGLEVKSETGMQSDYQKAFEKVMEYGDGQYYIVRSVADVIEKAGL